jgi:hypothetical protein
MIALLSAAALIAASGPAPSTGDPVPQARGFLEVFFKDPRTTKDLVTDDALFAAGDIGGSYAKLLGEMHGDRLMPASCKVQSLASKPLPSEAEMRGYPAPSFQTPGQFALVTGSFACPGPDGPGRPVEVTIYLKDGRVLLFGFAPRRPGK